MKGKPVAKRNDYLRPTNVYRRFPANYKPRSIRNISDFLDLESLGNPDVKLSSTVPTTSDRKDNIWVSEVLLPNFTADEVTCRLLTPRENSVIIEAIHTTDNGNNSSQIQKKVWLPSDVDLNLVTINSSSNGHVTISAPIVGCNVTLVEDSTSCQEKGLPYVKHRLTDILHSIYNGELFSHDVHRDLHNNLSEIKTILDTLEMSTYGVQQLKSHEILPSAVEGEFKFQVEVTTSGYTVEEISIHQKEADIVVEGRHEEKSPHGATSIQQTHCKIPIPKGVVVDAISSQMHEDGGIHIEAPFCFS